MRNGTSQNWTANAYASAFTDSARKETLYFPICGSIPEVTAERAGRSVWYDRRVRNAEAAGSNPARSIETVFNQNLLIAAYTLYYCAKDDVTFVLVLQPLLVLVLQNSGIFRSMCIHYWCMCNW